MPATAGIPSLAGLLPNPLEVAGQAVAQAPIAAAQQDAALEQKGWETINPYVTALARNPNLAQNQSFVNQMEGVARRFRISGPVIDQAIQALRSQLGNTGAGAMGGAAPSPAGAASGGGAAPTGSAASPPGAGAVSGGAAPAPAGQPGQPTPASAGAAVANPPDQQQTQAAQIYQQDLDAAARTPAVTGHPDYHAKILKDGKALGRNPAQIAADVKAAQVKAGVGPHPETQGAAGAGMPGQAQQTQIGQQQGTGGTAQPAIGAPGAGAAGPAGAGGPWTGGHALPPETQALMAAAGVAPSGMQAFGTAPIEGSIARLIAEAPSSGRPQLYAMAGVDPSTVPASVMNATQVMTAAQAGLEQNRVFNQALSMVKQGMDPSAIFAQAAASGAITPEMAQAYTQDPAFIEPMREAATRNLGYLHDVGLLKKASYDRAVQEIAQSKSTVELNQARTKLVGIEAANFDATTTARVAQAWATVSHLGEEDDSGTWVQKQDVTSKGVTQQITQAQKDVTSAQHAFDTLFAAGQKMLDNPLSPGYGDPSGVMLPTGVPYGRAIHDAQQALDAAKTHLKSLTSGAADKTADPVLNKASGTAHVVTGKPPFTVPQGYKAAKQGNQWGVIDANGRFFPYQGGKQP